MQSRELFAAAVRILGIWFLYQAGYSAVFLAMRLSDVLNRLPEQTVADKILVGFHLVCAILLLSFADRITVWLYGETATALASKARVPE